MANHYSQYPYVYGQTPTQHSYYEPNPYQTAQQYPTQYPTGYQQPQQPTVQPQSTNGPPQYPCLHTRCAAGQISFTRYADLQRHINSFHNRDLVTCTYVDPTTGKPCHRRGEYGFTRRDKMIGHMRAVHKVEPASVGQQREG
ncbi:hypothetical protein D0859_02521 [Hortaea werneckii]|uniref:C2H2-type domain-containing protein n=1 Tax=Hortaea werneckii TaxID=91943 RepID=A0A3M7J6F1_HORWE|nr:hypothetical protein D0859_02521 [Hortaea werneckii]